MLKRFFCALVLAGAVFALSAQTIPPALTLTTSSPVYPGATLSVNVGLTGSGASNIAAFGFTLPAASTAPTVGVASTAAGKAVYSNAANVLLVSPVTAPNSTAYADGPVASFTYTVPLTATFGSTVSLALTNPLAASSTGNAVVVTSAPLVATVAMSPVCVQDIVAATTAYLSSPTQAALNLIVTDLAAGQTGGACH